MRLSDCHLKTAADTRDTERRLSTPDLDLHLDVDLDLDVDFAADNNTETVTSSETKFRRQDIVS